jgi:uncharacterized protein
LKNPSELRIDVAPHGATSAIVYPAENTAPSSAGALILAHGAGAGQRSPFITEFARAIASRGFDVVTFNFLYAERRRRAPDKAPVLEACYRAVISAVEATGAAKHALFIGGKSMGGRIATQVAAGDRGIRVAGLVLLGYPLHPPGRPQQRRDAHLPSVERPMLFVQGSRDAFGTPEELAPVLARLGSAAVLHVVDGGDHSFKVSRAGAPPSPADSTRASARQAAVYEDVQRIVAEWMVNISGR